MIKSIAIVFLLLGQVTYGKQLNSKFKAKLNARSFSKEIDSIENYFIKRLKKTKNKKKLKKIEKEMNIIKIGRKAEGIIESFSLENQNILKETFEKKMKLRFSSKKSNSNEGFKLLGINTPSSEISYAINLIAGSIRQIQTQEKRSTSLFTLLNLRESKYFIEKPGEESDFDRFSNENITEEDKKKIIRNYKASSSKGKAEIRKKMVEIYKAYLKKQSTVN